MTLPRLKFPTRDDRAVDLPVRQTSHMVMLVLILLFGFALRVFDLEYMPPFAHYDGINLAEYSVKVLRGEVPLYGVRLDGDPNWAFAQFAPYLLFGGNLWALRVTTALWSVLVLSVAYFGVRQMFGARVAIAATFLMTAGHVFIHFSREATIVLPSVLTSFLTIGLYLKAQRQGGRARYALFGLAGAALAVNLYEYAAAKSVFFAVAALWLFAVPHRKRDWSAYLRDTACFAFGFVIVATPILWWYLQRPADLFDRLGFLSIFHPRNAAINQRLYGQVDTLTLLYHQTLRSLGGFFVFWDTSPNYHFESALLDPATAILMIPGLCIALLRKPKLTAIILVWMAAGLIAGAILLIEPPTSYHYIVLIPLASIFAAICLDWLAASRIGLRCLPLLLFGVGLANSYLYFSVYPYKGAWYSLESAVGLYVRESGGCCKIWYAGEPEMTPRKISALIAMPTPIQYVRDDEQLLNTPTEKITDGRTAIIIIPPEKAEGMMPHLRKRFPGGYERVHKDRGRVMFRTYTCFALVASPVGLTR